ncbi:purine-cytosine permease family protein [Alteribacter aurantiacus]|uniref:purine-cytosine permease family protein n=1 Tax=Alteribacter aurantiacus TaxID=254410 RepID=UPI00040D58CE|nr:cytosine permease [Alteribacter aurantiacus]
MGETVSKRQTTFERLGLESVPLNMKTTKASDYVRIQTAVAINAGNFLVPAIAVLEGGLNFYAAVLSTMLGACFAFLFVSLLAIPGAKYGLPAQFVIRSMIGTKGAMYLSSPVRTITSLYWFGVQTVGGTYILKEILFRSFGVSVPFLWLSLPLALLMAYLALVGFDALKRLTVFVLPLMAVAATLIVYVYVTNDYDGQSAREVVHFIGHWSLPTMILFGSLAFVQYVSGAGTSSDIARYGKSPKHAFWGIFIGNSFGFFITSVLGAFTATIAMDWNPFVVATQMTDSFLIITIIFLAAILSMVTINLNNAYTGGYSLLNSFPRLGRVKSAAVFGLMGICISGSPVIVEEAEQFIYLLGTVIIPLTAVFIADYVFVKKRTLTNTVVDRLISGGESLNKVGACAFLFGVVIYIVVPEGYSPSFVSFFSTQMAYLMLVFMNRR